MARFIERTLPIPFECGSDLPRLEVKVWPYERGDEQPSKIVDGLLAQGFRYPDIAVVGVRPAQRSAFAGCERAGRHSLRQFKGEYDLFGNQLSTDGRFLEVSG